jgi:SlyX protein
MEPSLTPAHPPTLNLLERHDERLTELEIKASFSEDLLDQLNQVIVRQQQQIDALIREVGWLRQAGVDGGQTGARNPHDDLPPHY